MLGRMPNNPVQRSISPWLSAPQTRGTYQELPDQSALTPAFRELNGGCRDIVCPSPRLPHHHH